MTSDADEGEPTILAPNDAFATLGNEIRMEILQTLGEADDPLSFSELRDHVGMRDSGQFNYHLDKLTGHFVEKTDAGYDLRQAGRRVVEAVLSGSVTEAPVIEPTRIDQPCQYCGAPVEVSYREEHVTVACTECAGSYAESAGVGDRQRLGVLALPPAAVEGRSPGEVLQAAYTWGGLEVYSIACGVCPRCGASVDTSVSVCSDHDATDGLCAVCDSRYAVHFSSQCTNCIHDAIGAAGVCLTASTEFLEFVTSHGINPLAPSSLDIWGAAIGDYEENVLSTDPFEARFTFSIDDDLLTLTVDEDLTVVDVTQSPASGSS